MFINRPLQFSYYKRLYSSKSIANCTPEWTSVIGLEIHAQIASVSKLFSGASTHFASPVNTNVSLFDCSIPGTLPVLNKHCVRAGVLTALALNCRISPVSMFDRKHYFYADMPAGYQITQQRSPLATDGTLQFPVFTPGVHRTSYKTCARLKQLQLEQDSGKSLHDTDKSLIDLNRAGVPLMELVFEPDLADGEEAAALIKELIIILQKLGTCSCKMEEGALRVDANVSLHRKGEPLGTRTEIKNIGSIRGVANAISYEIERQMKVKTSGGSVTNETRAWDAVNRVTVAMRDKEEQQDYRYMPEPNLPPLHLAIGESKQQDCLNMDKLRKSIPEMPEQTRQRLQEVFGLTIDQSIILVNESCLLILFEGVISKKVTVQGKLLANILINDFMNVVNNKTNLNLEDIRIDSDIFGEIIELLEMHQINRNTVKLLINELIQGNTKAPSNIIKENGWMQITDLNKLRTLCEDVLNDNEKLVQQYKAGKVKVLRAFLGLIASRSNQKADIAKCELILKQMLSDSTSINK